MRILIVDDERSFGSLLGKALKRLGHRAVVKTRPADALEVVRAEPPDAVIADLEMPEMSGVDLARAIRAEDARVPIAFCNGRGDGDGAADLGSILPRVWTVADVRRLVDDLRRVRPTPSPPPPEAVASGSSPRRAPVASTLPAPETVSPPSSPSGSPRGAPPRRAPRGSSPPMGVPVTGAAVAPRAEAAPPKLRVDCPTWNDARRVCSHQSGGRHYLAVRGQFAYAPGDPVTVALSLPDELVIAIAAQVVSVRPADDGSRRVFALELIGLTDAVKAQLLALADAASA
jgi:hypothetical protein